MKITILLTLAIAAAVAFAPTPPIEKVYAKGDITDAELVKLDTGYKAIEKGSAQMLELLGQFGNNERVQDARALAQLNVENAAAYRAGFIDAYLFNEVEPPPVIDPPVIEPGDPTVLTYKLSPLFESGGQYGHLGTIPEDARRGAIYGGPFKDWGGACWAKTCIAEIPESIWNRTVIFNDDAASWGEHGPMRATREVNVTGVAKGITYWRPGDWTMGRDGHGFYWNVLGNVELDDCHVFEGGGQGFQFVSRPSETGIPYYDDPENPTPEADTVTEINALGTVTIRNCSAIDCGQIEYGMMVHSSFPFSYFNPGQSLDIDGLTIRCEFPAFTDKYGTQFQSRGGVFIGPGQIGTARTPSVVIRNLDIEITRSDRTELILWGVDTANVIQPRIIDHGGTNDVKLVVQGQGAIGSVVISETQTELQIQLFNGNPHKTENRIKTVTVPVGGSFSWPE